MRYGVPKPPVARATKVATALVRHTTTTRGGLFGSVVVFPPFTRVRGREEESEAGWGWVSAYLENGGGRVI